MNRTRCLLFALGSLLAAATAQAQYELKSGNFNNIFVAQTAAGADATPSGPPVVGDPPPTSSQFSAMGQVAGGTRPLSITTVYVERYPSNPARTLVLAHATIGGVFASGVPRYSLGDVITPPLAQVDGVTPAAPGYWRLQPVLPGEAFQGVNSDTPLFPLGSVNVTTSATDSTLVTVATPLPPELVVGATLLGQPVTGILGTTVTLAGNANSTISGSTATPITPASSYYYSPHAEKVFASQAGRVTIAWVTRVADGGGNYSIRNEDFAVSSNTALPVRTIYWTEGSFDGPKVQITDNRITTVNPAYYNLVPKAVAQEVIIPGYSPLAPNLTTLSFEKFSGIGQLRAYNVEGRILIEYLGDIRLAGNIHESIGTDVVELVRVPEANYNTVHLGQEIAPHEPSVSIAPPPGPGHTARATATVSNGAVTAIHLIDPGSGYGNTSPVISFSTPDSGTKAAASATLTHGVVTAITVTDGGSGYPELTASPVLSSVQNATNFYSENLRPDSTSAYFAERETSAANDPDNGSPASQDAYNKVVFYWMKEGAFSIKWPQFQDRYWLRWSPNLNDYAHYSVDASGGSPDTGVPFTDGSLPAIVYQDDPAQSEAQIDLSTQRLYVNFAEGSDQKNRSLLKFSASASTWYVNLYTQAENRAKELVSTSTSTATTTVTVASTAGLTVGMSVTGPGITGSATILNILSDTQLILSQNIPDGTNDFIYGATTLSSITTITPETETIITVPDTSGLVVGGQLFNSTDYVGRIVTILDGFRVAVIRVPAYIGSYPRPYLDDGPNFTSFWSPGFADYLFEGTYACSTPPSPTISVSDTSGLASGMFVTGPDVPGGVTIASVTDATRLVLSQAIAVGTRNLTYAAFPAALSSTSQTFYSPSILTVSTTTGLETGMIVNGPGIDGSAIITRIINGTTFEISQTIPDATFNLSYTVQSDSAAPINVAATVGTRLVQPAGHENAGYISSGSNYYPDGYLNPFVVGVTAANQGAIIPVNAMPTDKQLTVRWFRKIAAPSADFNDLYVPGKIGRYTVNYPAGTSPQIVIAQGIGTGDLSAAQAAGEVYYQNDPALPGYNPNEEHALPFAPRVYALRDDLNVTSGSGYTSEPFVLVAYTDPADHRPAIHAYKVIRTNETHDFNFIATAGTQLIPPYPLPLMPLPLVGSGANLSSKNLEIIGADDPANTTLAQDDAYKGFTFKDRKGFTWIHRGPHDAGEPALSMKLYYLSRAGFFIPGTAEPAVGTVLPFLRHASRSGQPLNITAINANADGTPGQIDEPLTIVYEPEWPVGAPELRVGETLTLPKFGLPQVRGQMSAQVLYQQSLANAATVSGLTKSSVTLHDPTREKTVVLGAPGVNLNKLPAAIKTTSYQGKTYFQGLPPQLQQRLYLNPLIGPKGTLVFIGEFHDVAAGEDYLDLNLLTVTEEDLVKGLVPIGATGKSDWDAAIELLNTRVETFKNDPAQFGSYVVDRFANVGENELAAIDSPNTAVDSYAVTATGQGTGYVTMVFGDGLPKSTPEGDPVQVQVFKIANQLYVGDLKVIQSSNPLDEQVTLRHSGDFAGKPEDYEFEWRWATAAATAPAIYTTESVKRIGDPVTSTHNWLVVRDPGSLLPSAGQYATAAPALLFPRTENVHPVNYVLNAQNQPTATVIDETSYTDAEIAADYPALVMKSSVGVDFTGGVPGNIVFSATLGTADGCVLYVNGRAALAYNAPTPRFTLTNASSGLSQSGLARQFGIAPSYFTSGSNIIEVAVYTSADPNVQSSLNFMLEADEETDVVISGSVWQTPAPGNSNTAIVGGSPTLPFGGPQFVLNDRWFTMRYKPKASANNVLGETYSRWMEPQAVEGWIKRVLAAINPFEQRVKDLYNNQINSDVSVITQAGKRWEGDIALNMDNINDVGLIEIYETVLNRGRSLSIDANTNDPDTNNALILAAGYLNDLYSILGNEAYADAANPTISLDDPTSVTEVNTSRFSFEGQVASSLDEELALLRGRDDSVSPGVKTAPGYNRLYWNYTRGINSGEVIYAVNYNVKEKVGSSTADGVIDEEDAQRQFPQGHGDAYGHFLTALTGYYQLLSNENFDWTPRAEIATVLGQPVTVDYLDERKFAAAAGNVARTAQQVAALTFRQGYQDDPAAGWASFRDTTGTNPQTGVTRRQGLDEWVSRGTQGAFFHWAVANALLPDEDIVNTGVQKIDRGTVPEIAQLTAAAASLQATADNASAHLNPLGLSPGAIAFDLDPAALQQGDSHYEQVSGRALRALNNAKGSFDQAAKMTRSLRNQQNQIDDYTTTLVQQEIAYVNQLLDIYGRPYSGDIGAGKLYAQGYTGPDLEHWFIVDRPNDLVNTGKTFSVSITEADQIAYFTDDKLADIKAGLVYYTTDANGVRVQKPATYTNRSVTIQPSQWVQYNDVWKTGGLGSRAETGELQDALQDAQQSLLAISEANVRYQKTRAQLDHAQTMLQARIQSHIDQVAATASAKSAIAAARGVAATLNALNDNKVVIADGILKAGNATAEAFPRLVGLSNDVTSTGRAAALFSSKAVSTTVMIAGAVAKAGAAASELLAKAQESDLAAKLRELGFREAEVQMAYEAENLFRETITHANELMRLTITHQRALQNVNNVIAKGNRILAEREVFRQRAAAIVQGYRTKDLTFRLFRNEALEQYRSLFDLASRYSYLAAKSYDYETGLLGTSSGRDVFAKIVASRSLGDLTGGVPQSTTSTLGDAGLAGTMAQLNADFSVAEGRLGINNPDQHGTVFSLRSELFRILNDPATTSDDDAWRQAIELHIKPDLMTDPDVATHCRNLRKPNGTPVPGIVIPFSTSIEHGKNFFGLPLAAGDHAYTPSTYATKIYNVGIALPGYVGMDAYAAGNPTGAPTSSDPNALSATPYVYLIPCGADFMLAPPLGDTNTLRSWNVKDQALPLPYNLGANDFNDTQFFSAAGTLNEQPWILRKHQAFRMIDDPTLFYSRVPAEFTNSRLIGRSVWNGQWKIVIPAYTLLNNEYDGLNKFAASVRDIQLFLRTYSHSGN